MSAARSIGHASRAPLVALLLGTAGCATLHPVEEPAEFIPRTNPAVVYVTFKNHSKVTLSRPRVSGDSLYGVLTGVLAPLGAPLTHIERVEAMQRNRARTVWLVASVTAAAAVGVLVLTNSGESGFVHPCLTAGTDECDFGYYRPGR